LFIFSLWGLLAQRKHIKWLNHDFTVLKSANFQDYPRGVANSLDFFSALRAIGSPMHDRLQAFPIVILSRNAVILRKRLGGQCWVGQAGTVIV
jgi:hypothetical protein